MPSEDVPSGRDDERETEGRARVSHEEQTADGRLQHRPAGGGHVAELEQAVPGAAGTLLYFSMLGLGYIAVQAVLIQGLTLVIGYPTLAITVTIATMLGASGVGSLCAPRLCAGPRGLRDRKSVV